jgi:cell division septal protein FtsQ
MFISFETPLGIHIQLRRVTLSINGYTHPTREMKINLVARLPALTAILLSLTLATRDVLGESSSSSHSSSIRDLKVEGDALLAKGEYLGASRAYSNAIGESRSIQALEQTLQLVPFVRTCTLLLTT